MVAYRRRCCCVACLGCHALLAQHLGMVCKHPGLRTPGPDGEPPAGLALAYEVYEGPRTRSRPPQKRAYVARLGPCYGGPCDASMASIGLAHKQTNPGYCRPGFGARLRYCRTRPRTYILKHVSACVMWPSTQFARWSATRCNLNLAATCARAFTLLGISKEVH